MRGLNSWILKLRLGSLFGENHPPFRSYWSLSIFSRGVPVYTAWASLHMYKCVRSHGWGRWWCALNDYLAIAQFVRGHRSAGNNLSCHQMFRSVTIHLKWIFFLIFKHSAKSQVASAVSQKINFCRKMRRLTNFITKLLQLFIFLDQIPANKWLVAARAPKGLKRLSRTDEKTTRASSVRISCFKVPTKTAIVESFGTFHSRWKMASKVNRTGESSFCSCYYHYM